MELGGTISHVIIICLEFTVKDVDFKKKNL